MPPYNATAARRFVYGPGAAFSPDGSQVVTTGDDRTARVWDAATGRRQFVIEGPKEGVQRTKYSPDGRRIVVAFSDGTVGVYDAGTGARLVIAGEDGTAKIWDIGTGQELATLPGHTTAVQCAYWNQDGGPILTVSADGAARQYLADLGALLDLAAARLTRALTPDEQAHYPGVAPAAVLPDTTPLAGPR